MEFNFLDNFQSLKTADSIVECITNIGKLNIHILKDDLVRVRFTSKEEFEKDFSYAVIENNWQNTFKVNEDDNKVFFTTSKLIIEINKNPLRVIFKDLDGNVISDDENSTAISVFGNEITAYKEISPTEKFFGLGEKTGNLDRRGRSFKMWNTDFPGYGIKDDPLYVSIPFFIGLRNHKAYGYLLDNTYESFFDMGASQDKYYSFSVKGGELNYYFFYGPEIKTVIERYTELTGKPDMPPVWALGYQQCRWSYFPETYVENIVRTFRDKKIPLDVMYLDIDWMDEYRVFEWDKTCFPDPKKMNSKLNDLGVKTVTIIDPGVKADKEYFVASSGLEGDHFVKYPNGELYTGSVWAGESYFPDFTKEKTRYWWSEFFKDMTEKGVSGFWNDMNEPAVWGQTFPDIVQFDYDGLKKSHKAVHNVYGMQMARSSYEGTKKYLNGLRPFIITRAAYAGVQRYSSVWTGDNSSSEEHYLQGAVMVQGLNLSGVSFCGPDIGGFEGEPTKELFERWVQLGVYTPFFRTHSIRNSKVQEPWSFGEDVENNVREMIKTRYRLLPYIYTAFYESSKYGLPIVKPLFWFSQNDEHTYNEGNQYQYYFGNNLLITAARVNQDYTKVYLPEGTWYEFDTKIIHQGKTEIITESKKTRLPVFVKAGSVIPMRESQDYTTQNEFKNLELHVYPGENYVNYFYEDDGLSYSYKNGDYLLRKIELNHLATTLNLDITHDEGHFKSKIEKIDIFIYNINTIESLNINDLVNYQYQIVNDILTFTVQENNNISISVGR